MKKMKKGVLIFLSAVCLCGAGCGAQDKETQEEKTQQEKQEDSKDESRQAVTKETFAMDTYMNLTGYGERAEEAVDAALTEIARLDQLLSTGNPESEISQINRQGSAEISEDTAVLIEKALETGQRTGGRFDITIYPVMVEWGFTSGEFHVPETEKLQELLELVDYQKVQFDRKNMTVALGEGQGMDLGGIAKGYTSDRIMEIFREYGLDSGIVSLGGNVECLGTKTDGSLWRCGIRDPFDEEALLGVVSVQDSAVITSGAYERNFTDETTGKLYHHIIDPLTGYPADHGLVSVTVISRSGMLADALSTSMYILGLDGAVQYWQQYGSDFDLVLMTDDSTVYVTEGLEEQFTSDYETVIVRRQEKN